MAADEAHRARPAGGELRELLRLIGGTDIEELELEVAGTRFYFKRPPSSAALPSSNGTEQAPVESPGPLEVSAGRVGFFHYPSEPAGERPRVGDPVAEGQVLGLIDSLSVPNPVHAPCAGVLAEVLVEDGQAVEYGQPLFRIELGQG